MASQTLITFLLRLTHLSYMSVKCICSWQSSQVKAILIKNLDQSIVELDFHEQPMLWIACS